MSKFTDKIRAGEVPTDEDWADHLVKIHRLLPRSTSEAITLLHTLEGQTSYDVLACEADALAAPTPAPSATSTPTLVDLGCGDGILLESLLPRIGNTTQIIGIDFCGPELAIARRLYPDPRVRFQNADARALPLPEGSVDQILSHFAFMLMLPIEPVVSEIHRVLKAGGTFSAIIPSPPPPSFLLFEIYQLVTQFVSKLYPRIADARMGEPRARTIEGLRSLFRSRPDFTFDPEIEITDILLQRRMSPHEAWVHINRIYMISWLLDHEKEELQAAIEDLVASRLEHDGRTPLPLPVWKVRVKKLPSTTP